MNIINKLKNTSILNYKDVELCVLLNIINENNRTLNFINKDDDLLYTELLNDTTVPLLFSIINSDKNSIIDYLMIDNIYPCDGNYDLYYFALISYSIYFRRVLLFVDLNCSLFIDDLISKYIELSPKYNPWHDNQNIILNLIKNIMIKRNLLEKEEINNMFGDVSDNIFQHIIKFR